MYLVLAIYWNIYWSILNCTSSLAWTDRQPDVIPTKVSVTFFILFVPFVFVAIFAFIFSLHEAFPVWFLTYNISCYFCFFDNNSIFVMANKTYIYRFLEQKKIYQKLWLNKSCRLVGTGEDLYNNISSVVEF